MPRRTNRLPPGAHQAASRARIARADAWAADVAPASRSCRWPRSQPGAIAAELIERRIRTPRGVGEWQAGTVAPLVTRLPV
jgi:hypothetical protein